MKVRTVLTTLCGALLVLAGCSSDPPSVRVRNELSVKANVQFKPASGNTININDVAGNSTTGYQEFPVERFDVSASIQSSADAPTATFSTQKDYNYTVVIMNTKPATMRVDGEEK